MTDYTLQAPSQRYDRYTAKMQRVKNGLDILRRYRVLLIAVGAAVLTAAVCFLFLKGCFIGEAKCGDFLYGEKPNTSLTAFLSKVSYQYAPVGEEAAWWDTMPTEPGLYRIRAVAKTAFGLKRFSEEMTANILPRKLKVWLAGTNYTYGEFGEAFVEGHTESEGLAQGDRLWNVQYTQEGSQQEGYRVDVAKLQVVNASGEDVSACYIPETEGGSFTMVVRPITVTVDSREKVYDGDSGDTVTAQVTEGTIAPGDRLSISSGELPTDVGIHSIKPQCGVMDAVGKDVSSCYDITVVAGTWTITPRPLRSAAAAQKRYMTKHR